MIADLLHYAGQRAHIAAAGIGNAAAWVVGPNFGAWVSALTAVVTLVAFAIKKLGGAVLDLRLRRDKIESAKLRIQLERAEAENRELQKALDALEHRPAVEPAPTADPSPRPAKGEPEPSQRVS